VREHEDASYPIAHRPAYVSRRLVSAAARLASRVMMRIVSSPAIVPTASGSRARSITSANACAGRGPFE